MKEPPSSKSVVNWPSERCSDDPESGRPEESLVQPWSECRGCVVEVASPPPLFLVLLRSAPFFQFSDATRRSVGWRQPSVLRVPSCRARPVSRPRNPLVRSFSLCSSSFLLASCVSTSNRRCSIVRDRPQKKRWLDAMKRVVVVVARRSRGFR